MAIWRCYATRKKSEVDKSGMASVTITERIPLPWSFENPNQLETGCTITFPRCFFKDKSLVIRFRIHIPVNTFVFALQRFPLLRSVDLLTEMGRSCRWEMFEKATSMRNIALKVFEKRKVIFARVSVLSIPGRFYASVKRKIILSLQPELGYKRRARN